MKLSLNSPSIDLVSTSRADFDLLTPLFEKLSQSRRAKVRMVLGGTHLDNAFGHRTESESLAIKYPGKVYFLDSNQTDLMKQLDFFSLQAELYRRFQTRHGVANGMVILGDRFELLAYTSLALLQGTKIFHLHGGEKTEGAIDDRIRPAVSLLSDYHFVSTVSSKNRLLKLGIPRQRILVTGPFVIDVLCQVPPVSIEDLLDRLNFSRFKIKKLAMVTLHSETTHPQNNAKNVKSLKRVLQVLLKSSNWGVVITGPNSDPGSVEIWDGLKHVYGDHLQVRFVLNLGFPLYLQTAKKSSLIIGNSSSGIIEMPFLGIPVVNIGDRQKGRERMGRVVELKSGKSLSEAQLKKIFNSQQTAKINKLKSPAALAAQTISKVLK